MTRRSGLLFGLVLATGLVWAILGALWLLWRQPLGRGAAVLQDPSPTAVGEPTTTLPPAPSPPQTSDEDWLRCTALVVVALTDAGQGAESFASLGALGDNYGACDQPVMRMAERSGDARGLLNDCRAPANPLLAQVHRHLSTAVDDWIRASVHAATFCYTGAFSELAEVNRYMTSAIEAEEEMLRLLEEYQR